MIDLDSVRYAELAVSLTRLLDQSRKKQLQSSLNRIFTHAAVKPEDKDLSNILALSGREKGSLSLLEALYAMSEVSTKESSPRAAGGVNYA